MQMTTTKAKFAAVGAGISLPTGVELWQWIETLTKWDAPPLVDALVIAIFGALITYFATFFAPPNKPVVNSFTLPLLLVAAVILLAGCKPDDADKIVNEWRTKTFATFAADTCPYIKTTKEEYVRAWDRQLPYGFAVMAFTENQRQYFPDISKDTVGTLCFIKPA
jgi:hypothetical protein